MASLRTVKFEIFPKIENFVKKIFKDNKGNLSRSELNDDIFNFINNEYIKIKNKEIRSCSTKTEKEHIKRDYMTIESNLLFIDYLMSEVYNKILEYKISLLETK